MSGSAHRVIFAGGGTGGHLFPALAIAEELHKQSGGRASCVFLCSDRPLDARILSAEGVEFVPSPAKPIVASIRGVTRFLGSWGPSLREARALIRRLHAGESPPIVVAMGGFVAAPAAQAARAERAPLVLVNLDAVPGKANRWIARRADRVFSSIAVQPECGPKSAHDWQVVPPIVRSGALAPADPATCRRALGIDPDRPTLMITGGSQGASSINALLAAMLTSERTRTAFTGWQVLHQSGPTKQGDTSNELARAYAQAGVRCVVREFVGGSTPEARGEMARWWGAADLAIARAGANTVAEAWANRVPTVFLPYPYHRDQHQRVNARALVGTGGCWLCTDHIDPDSNLAEAGERIASLLRGPDELMRARGALRELPEADGAARLAAVLLERTP